MPTPSKAHANIPSAPDLVVRGRRVVTPEGERPAAIHIRGGVITAVSAFDDIPAGCAVHEAGESAVMPGLVDTHVHINEPGRTEWEGFVTATRAAAAGGGRTLIQEARERGSGRHHATRCVEKKMGGFCEIMGG